MSAIFGSIGTMLLAFATIPQVFQVVVTRKCPFNWIYLWGLWVGFCCMAINGALEGVWIMALNFTLQWVLMSVMIWVKLRSAA